VAIYEQNIVRSSSDRDFHCTKQSSVTRHSLSSFACCVAHLSSAGEYIDTVDRDIDAIRVLVKDGSSDTVLVKAMTRIWITA